MPTELWRSSALNSHLTSTIRTAAKEIVLDTDGCRALWAEYFVCLYVAEPSRQLSLSTDPLISDPPIAKTAEVRKPVRKSKS